MSKTKQFIAIVMPYALLSLILSVVSCALLINYFINDYTGILSTLPHGVLTIALLKWLTGRSHTFAAACVSILGFFWAFGLFVMVSSYLSH